MKSPRKKLVVELDRVFSLYIRRRDGRCVLCEKVEGLTCGHLLTRTAFSTRWDVDNCFGQCAGCNLRHEHKPEYFTQWYINKFSLRKYNELIERHHKIKKFTSDDLQRMIIYYKAELGRESA